MPKLEEVKPASRTKFRETVSYHLVSTLAPSVNQVTGWQYNY